MDLLAIGMIIGVLFTMFFNYIMGNNTHGNIIIDRSTGEPYILLEISNEELQDIPKQKYVTFKVVDEDLPRK